MERIQLARLTGFRALAAKVARLAQRVEVACDTSLARRLGLLVALAFAYSIMFSFSYFNALTYVCPNHIGSMFKMAVDVADGLALYGQTYSQYGPLPTWIQALALSVFGRNVIVSGMTTMVFACATLFVLQRVWSRLLPVPYVALAIVLQAVIQPENSFPWPNGYMACFAAGTLLAVISYFEKASVWKLVAAGVCTAAVMLCRQQGVVLFLFVFVCLLVLFQGPHKTVAARVVAAGWYSVAAWLPIAAYLLSLQARHMLVDFYKQTILIIPVAYTSGDLSLRHHLETLLANFFLPDRLLFISLWCVLALICMCYVLALFFGRALEEPKSRVLFLCCGFALVGMLNAYPLPDDFRYAYGMAPATAVVVYLLYTAFAKVLAPVRLLSVLLVLGISFSPAIEYVYTHYNAGLRLLRKGSLDGYVKVNVPPEIAGTFHPAVNEQFYTKLDRLLSQYTKLYPDTSFISLGVEPLMVTFLRHNRNAHPMPFIWWSKTGTMYDGGENQTINALLYPDYWAQVNDFIARNQPLLYTYGQPIKGYKPIFENAGGVGFPVYWASQWRARPLVSIQAPVERADKFLASTNAADFFAVPERIVISKVSGTSSAQRAAAYPLENLVDARIDTFMSYSSTTPFELELALQLQKPSVVSKITLYPRVGFEKLLPRYITIAGSLDGRTWKPMVASFADTINDTQAGSVFSFNPQEVRFLKMGMHSSEYGKAQFVQIAEMILD